MVDTAYAAVGDLLLGDVPLPPYVSAQKFINDAADEVDSKIGQRYITPIDVSDTSTVPRHSRLAIKRITYMLASGRLLMTLDAGHEDKAVNAYGLSLIKEATAALDAIAAGDMDIDGADPSNPGSPEVKAALIFNVDPESQVEAFYNRIANPNFVLHPDSERSPVRDRFSW